MRYTTKRNGKNVIPLLMAVCGINLPYWRIDRADDLHSYLYGDAADKLAAYEDAEAEAYALHCGDETPITNADRIRAMTDEELDRFLSGVHNNVGSGRAQISVWNNSDRPIRIWRTGWLDWLKQECEK